MQKKLEVSRDGETEVKLNGHQFSSVSLHHRKLGDSLLFPESFFFFFAHEIASNS